MSHLTQAAAAITHSSLPYVFLVLYNLISFSTGKKCAPQTFNYINCMVRRRSRGENGVEWGKSHQSKFTLEKQVEKCFKCGKRNDKSAHLVGASSHLPPWWTRRPLSRGSQLPVSGAGGHPPLRLDVVFPGSQSLWASWCYGSVNSKPQVQRWMTTTKSSDEN